jgi:hypothetical protein
VEQGGKTRFYQECANWLRVYNALCLPENEDHELTPWFYNEELDYLLADQPDLIRLYIPNSKVKRAKGIHADDDLITVADNKQDRWMKKVIGNEYKENDEGKVEIVKKILAIVKDRNLGYLREAYRYVRHKELNFDRVRTRGWIHMMKEEIGTREEQQEQKEDDMSRFLANTSASSRMGNGIPEQFNSISRFP